MGTGRQQGKKGQERLLSGAQKSTTPLLSPWLAGREVAGWEGDWMVGKELPTSPTQSPAVPFTPCPLKYPLSTCILPNTLFLLLFGTSKR